MKGPQRRAVRKGGMDRTISFEYHSTDTMFRIPSLLAFVLLVAQAVAQPPAILWEHVYGGSASEYMPHLETLPDGGWVLAGYSASDDGDVTGGHGDNDGWLVRTDASGAIVWQKAYGGSGNDGFNAVCPTSDGGYVVAGRSGSDDGDLVGNSGMLDAWVLKVNAAGAIQWQQTLGGALDDRFFTITPTLDGNYIAVGASHTNLGGDPIPHYGGFDGLVVKISPAGAILWQRIIGGMSDDEIWQVRPTSDGGYIVAGQSTSTGGGVIVPGNHGSWDAWVMKLDATGGIVWQRMIGGESVEQIFDLIVTADGGYLLCGWSSSASGDIPVGQGIHDVLLVKLEADGDTQWIKTHGTAGMDGAYNIKELADGSFLYVGTASAADGDATGFHGFSDVWLAKTDATGDLQWEGCMGGIGQDRGLAMDLTADGGLIIAANSNSADGDVGEALGGGDLWLIKTGALEVGVAEASTPQVAIGPNPTTGPLRLSFEQPLTDAVVSITDLHGRILRRERVNGTVHELDLTGEAAGAYLLRLDASDVHRSFPIVLAPTE